MRDPARIDNFIEQLRDLWHLVPDWRFGQLIVNVLGECTVDPFFMEDDKMIEHFRSFFDKAIKKT